MKGFIMDACPRFGETSVSLKDDQGNVSDYHLKRMKNNGCILSIDLHGVERDSIVFTMQDLRAIYMLLTVEKK
jgi:hypothetical protein